MLNEQDKRTFSGLRKSKEEFLGSQIEENEKFVIIEEEKDVPKKTKSQ